MRKTINKRRSAVGFTSVKIKTYTTRKDYGGHYDKKLFQSKGSS